MSFTDWDEDSLRPVREGLLILGWRPDARLTSDDALHVRDIAQETLELRAEGRLSPAEIERLAEKAFEYLFPQVMAAQERARMATGPYSMSLHMRHSIGMIDQAMVAFRNALFTAASALLYIVLERYLRSLVGWEPGQHITYAGLCESLRSLAPSEARDEVYALVRRVYQYYDPTHPPDFFFNRHGLLHGLRPDLDVDRLNCGRLFVVLDRLCVAEGLSRSVIDIEKYRYRVELYSTGRMDPAINAVLYSSM